MLLEGKMGHTNRSVQKFTRWARAAAVTWPEPGMGSAVAGHRWDRAWTDWQRLQHHQWEFSSQQQHRGAKNTQLANVWGSLQIKNGLKCISYFMEGLWGVTPEPSLSGEVRSGSSSTQHPGTSKECLVPWLQPKDNTLDCPCGLQSAAQAGTESHFTFLNNSETNTQTQTYFGHSQTRSGPRRRKKISTLLTPNWFYESMVRHYSTSLNDTHDLILQKLPHFLGQSPNLIF